MASPATINAKTGSTGIFISGDSFANLRALTTGTTSTIFYDVYSTEMARGFCNFDTSSIPTNATVSAVTFVIPTVGNFTHTESTTLHIVAHTGADPIVADDFNNITLNGDTSFGSVAFTGLSESATTSIVLNAAGIAQCQATVTAGTVTKYGIRSSTDINNSTPGAGNDWCTATLAGNAQIIVTYTIPGGSGLQSKYW